MNALSPASTDALVGSTALSPVGPDSELIAACARFCELERAWVAAGGGHIEFGSAEEAACEAERERIDEVKHPLIDRILELPCTTVAGLRAVAGALRDWDQELLKDGPGDVGDCLTAKLVSGLLAMAPEADAELIALSGEYCRLMDELNLTDFDAFSTRAEQSAQAEQTRIIDAACAAVDKMTLLRATTASGLIARCFAMGAHDAGHDFCYESEGTISRDMLDALLRDAATLRSSPPHPDAELLSLRPEYERLRAEVDAENARPGDWTDEIQAAIGKPFEDLCARIIGMPPAITRAGRALKAVAAAHELHIAGAHLDGDDGCGGALRMCWGLLAQEVDGVYAMPGARA